MYMFQCLTSSSEMDLGCSSLIMLHLMFLMIKMNKIQLRKIVMLQLTNWCVTSSSHNIFCNTELTHYIEDEYCNIKCADFINAPYWGIVVDLWPSYHFIVMCADYYFVISSFCYIIMSVYECVELCLFHRKLHYHIHCTYSSQQSLIPASVKSHVLLNNTYSC